MTVLQRIARIVVPRSTGNAPFERYYSQLLQHSAGTDGMPSAREAQRDLSEMRDLYIRYPYM